MNKRLRYGFSLIELVMVIVVISVGLLGISSLFVKSTDSLDKNEIIQQAAQYAQECAERALTKHRALGFDQFTPFDCGVNPAGFNYSTATSTPPLVGTAYSGTGSPCPTGTNNCRDINIRVTSTNDAALYSAITLMLVK